MRLKLLLLSFLLISFVTIGFCQTPFNRGVNLTNWFQTGSARQIQFTKFTKQDFVNIKSLGCDVIRLPINLHFMTNGSPSYTIDPLFYSFLDQAVDWAEELQIYLLLDNHTFDPATNTDPNVGTILVKVWKQMAEHYKNRSNYILYEILNEPHGITTQQWGQIQQTTIDAIRSVDTKHTIIVGASGFNSYNEMKDLPLYTDNNLLYTFHFYDPFILTHQGATWVSPSMAPLSGVPFPCDVNKMPACPNSLKGTWIESSLNNYGTDGTISKVKSLIDIAVNFKTSRNVNVFCGEFGVYIPNSNNPDRVYWYEIVQKYLTEKGIPWTIWDYTGGFGLFKKGSNELFEYDLNIELLQSLGLTVPTQKPFIIKADSVGFPIYTDYIETKIQESGSGGGTVDFYNDSKPNNGKYCIHWSGAPQYNSIGFDFKPDKDLSKLKAENYALDFMIRGNSQGSKFDIRFIDSKTSDPADHPWRMRKTIDNTFGAWDRHWHHIHIPLTAFTEHGSWDNGTWIDPQGKFDWKAIDRFEIVAEQEALTGKEFWFDNIHITNIDTAAIRDTSFLSYTGKTKKVELGEVKVYPNPMNQYTTIEYEATSAESVEIAIYNQTGMKIVAFANQNNSSGKYSFTWNRQDNFGNQVPDGLYILSLKTSGFSHNLKIIVNRSK